MDAVLEAIRENPVHEKKARSKPADAKSWKPKKLTYDERKAALKKKLEALEKSLSTADQEKGAKLSSPAVSPASVSSLSLMYALVRMPRVRGLNDVPS